MTTPIPPTRSTEVSAGELERIAHTLGLTVDLPPAEGGWARVETPRGARYHAFVKAVAS